jgi:hypothetical protein
MSLAISAMFPDVPIRALEDRGIGGVLPRCRRVAALLHNPDYDFRMALSGQRYSCAIRNLLGG